MQKIKKEKSKQDSLLHFNDRKSFASLINKNQKQNKTESDLEIDYFISKLKLFFSTKFL